MSSIGPQLPAELTKRKRTPDQGDGDGESACRPTKQAKQAEQHTATNDDEINLSDSDDDDDPGPRAPASAASIGPVLPPPPLPQPQPQPRDHQQQQHRDQDPSSDDDDFGPSLPSSSTPRPAIGPALLPSEEAAPRRDTWMLAPPPQTAYTERDPTRLRARKFASKPSSSAGKPSAAANDPPSIWTETPQQKLQRQRDALLGRAPPSSPSASAAAGHQRQQDGRLADLIGANRGRSLYAEHGERRKRGAKTGEGAHDEDEDDPSKRAFDREKDMAIGGRVGARARAELVRKSAGFGGRFEKGSFL